MTATLSGGGFLKGEHPSCFYQNPEKMTDLYRLYNHFHKADSLIKEERIYYQTVIKVTTGFL